MREGGTEHDERVARAITACQESISDRLMSVEQPYWYKQVQTAIHPENPR